MIVLTLETTSSSFFEIWSIEFDSVDDSDGFAAVVSAGFSVVVSAGFSVAGFASAAAPAAPAAPSSVFAAVVSAVVFVAVVSAVVFVAVVSAAPSSGFPLAKHDHKMYVMGNKNAHQSVGSYFR